MPWTIPWMLRDVFLFPFRARARAHARAPEGQAPKSSRNYPHIPLAPDAARLFVRATCGMCPSDIPHIPHAAAFNPANEVCHV